MPRTFNLSLFYKIIPILLGICVTTSADLNAQGHKALASSSQQPRQYSDTLRALIVFTQFKNDTFKGDPNVFQRDWPLELPNQSLPEFAKAILAPTPIPPFPDSSLTAYFYEQSMGQLILYGKTYDSVLVTLHEESRYHRPKGGYGDLTKELLDRIDANGFDFSKYDQNRDGYIDYLFVALRGDSKRDAKIFAWTGASCLDGRCSGTVLVAGGPRDPLMYDGKLLDWNRSGSYIMHRTPGNVSPFNYYIRLMAHEIGHDLWASHFVHIRDNRTNDVPAKHNRGSTRDCIGYVLMAGAGGAWDCGGSETISAYERDLLGWIDCTPLTSTSPNLVLGDLYTTGNCYTINLEGPVKRLYLSNLQRINYFDQERHVGSRGQFQIGLRTTGMLIHLRERLGLDVIPADNGLALGVTNDVYSGDLFGPSTSSQLTPWTRPNINGYTHYPPSTTPRWVAIDHIRESDSSDILFDFYSDFREHPIIREDSWMGSETENYQFDGPVLVSNQSTLHIESNLSFGGILRVETNSTLHIAEGSVVRLLPESTFELRHGAVLRLDGTLILDGQAARSPGSRIIRGDKGSLQSQIVRN